MADIELVIKIDEGIAKGIIDGENDTPRHIVQGFQSTIADAIKHGTPLPKGHGGIVDIKQVENVLDKVRAEIEQNAYPIVHGVNNHEKGMTLYGILQIIDKYKTESKVKV